WYGASHKVIKLVEEGKYELILTKEIIEEYNKILNSDEILDKKAYTTEKAAAAQKLIQIATIIEPKTKLSIVKDDPDDDKFIEAAIDSGAKIIVSQDPHLLNIGEYEGIKIQRPEELLDQQN
ncbi:MAG: putative toxin-antitoxin system toxin component, PIN family, partial [Candidatus Nanoarchaeia archaeon]